MSKSTNVRSADLLRVRSLVVECRELGDDALSWRQHLLAGSARLVGADVAMAGEFDGFARSPLRILGVAEFGWEGGFDRDGWQRSLQEFGADPLYHPAVARYLPRLAQENGVSLARRDLLEDREWYSSPWYQLINAVCGLDACIHCFIRTGPAGDEATALLLNRAVGERDFSRRECAIVGCLHSEVAALLGSKLARLSNPSPSALPPRVRQVLRCLLEGDSDKQICLRLELSRHTVNQYVKLTFRHFGVHSRTELLACWIRRAWGEQPGKDSWAGTQT